MKSAFSLIELLVALTILSLVTGAGIIGYRAAAQRQVVDSTVSQIVADLNKASANASAGVKDSTTCGATSLTGWQVTFTATSYKIEGLCGATVFSTRNIQLSPIVTLSALPSPNPILFKPLRAGTNIGLSTSVTVSGNGLSRYIQVNNFGRISAANDTASLPTDPTPGLTPTPTPTPLTNIAPQATVTVSSAYSATYAGIKAVDGVIGINNSGEWASNAELNPWIQLTWLTSVTVSKIILYDRPNTTDWASGGALYFSDGSQVVIPVGSIPNAGTAYTVNVTPRTVTWVKYQVGGGSGLNVGLSEIQVY